MSSRMNKYYNEFEQVNSRVKRNEELYKEINRSSLDNFDVKSNATVLGDSDSEIDVEKIKKILDTKYNEVPKRRSIRLETKEEEKEEREITKEYDINVILEKAKEQKEDNYEEERLKKIRDTEFNILKSLDLEKYEKKNQDEDNEEENLQNLINTIYDNEHNNSASSPLDILSDLKGSDDTEVLAGLKEDVQEQINSEDKKIVEPIISDTKILNSFYTDSNLIQDKDFEDMEDFAKEVNSSNIFIKLLIALIVVIFIGGVIILVKSIYF